MLKRFVMLALSVSLLGFSIGCGGPGEVTTVPAGERPDTSGMTTVPDEGGKPDGVMSLRPGGRDKDK